MCLLVLLVFRGISLCMVESVVIRTDEIQRASKRAQPQFLGPQSPHVLCLLRLCACDAANAASASLHLHTQHNMYERV